MQVKVENIPALSIVYMRRIGQYGEGNFKLMQDMKQWIQNHNLWDENGVIYGIAQDNAAVTPVEKCRYDVCFVTDSAFDDNAVQSSKLPSGEYLVFEIPHTTEDVGRFWGSFADALVKTDKQIDESRPILERYQIALVEKGFCEFCIPVL